MNKKIILKLILFNTILILINVILFSPGIVRTFFF